MSSVMIGGPLDGSVVQASSELPERLTMMLSARCGGGNAEYELTNRVYQFLGWKDEREDVDTAAV